MNDLEAAIAAQDVEASLEVLAELEPEWRTSDVQSIQSIFKRSSRFSSSGSLGRFGPLNHASVEATFFAML